MNQALPETGIRVFVMNVFFFINPFYVMTIEILCRTFFLLVNKDEALDREVKLFFCWRTPFFPPLQILSCLTTTPTNSFGITPLRTWNI